MTFCKRSTYQRARTGIAMSELPLGHEWYAFLVKKVTSTALSADEISRIGAAEVERLGAPPPREAPAVVAGGLVNAYKELQTQVQAALPAVFSEIPNSALEIQSTEWLPRPAASLYYRRGGPAGEPRAILYVDSGRGAKATLSIAAFPAAGIAG